MLGNKEEECLTVGQPFWLSLQSIHFVVKSKESLVLKNIFWFNEEQFSNNLISLRGSLAKYKVLLHKT
jgi:hypothetical protein